MPHRKHTHWPPRPVTGTALCDNVRTSQETPLGLHGLLQESFTLLWVSLPQIDGSAYKRNYLARREVFPLHFDVIRWQLALQQIDNFRVNHSFHTKGKRLKDLVQRVT
jgi:hypothetical protein